MDRFWKWMKEKGYGRNNGNGVIYDNEDVAIGDYIFPKKQALIGYMMLFLIENGQGFCQISDLSEITYEYLEKKIESQLDK